MIYLRLETIVSELTPEAGSVVQWLTTVTLELDFPAIVLHRHHFNFTSTPLIVLLFISNNFSRRILWNWYATRINHLGTFLILVRKFQSYVCFFLSQSRMFFKDQHYYWSYRSSVIICIFVGFSLIADNFVNNLTSIKVYFDRAFAVCLEYYYWVWI